MAGDPRALARDVIRQALERYPAPDDTLVRRTYLRTLLQTDALAGYDALGTHMLLLEEALTAIAVVELPHELPLPDSVTVIHLRRARLVPLEDAAFEYRLALLRVRATMLAALKALANVQYDPVVHGAQLIDHATAALATLDRPHAQYALAHRDATHPLR